MDKIKYLWEYDIKVLLSRTSYRWRKRIFRFLLTNGYPELGALANAIRADLEAYQWLIRYGF